MKPYLLLGLALFCFCMLHAQVHTNFNNTEKLTAKGKFSKTYSTSVDRELPAQNIKQLVAKENEANKGTSVKPLQIAEPMPVDIDVAHSIKWAEENATAYGRFTLRLKGALSASINFDRFKLPEGTEMYVYNEGGEMITGPVTAAENNEAGIWGSWAYKGDIITVEIKTPAATKDQLILHANNVAYGYKAIYKVIDFGASGACNINVLCAPGIGWEAERNSVALILNGSGSSLCSGSMLMNTCSTATPYFLTANHCFDNNVAGWRFTFQAWSPTCVPSQNANGLTFNGSTLRARNTASDFCLVELSTTPAVNSNIHYAGWNRSSTAATQATAIHHPQGDVMKISRANSGTTVGSFAGTTNQHWRTDWSALNDGNGNVTVAVTEPGSSGSPLFDQNHRVVGQLHGGPSTCTATNLWDFYGRFDLSWTGGGTAASRLSDWLDPGTSGATTTNTTNISALGCIGCLSITGPAMLCSPGTTTLTLNGAAPGASVIWTSNNTSAATIIGSSSTATVTWSGTSGEVAFTATTACGIVHHYMTFGTIMASDIQGIDPFVYANAGATLQLSVYESADSYNWSIGGGYIIGDPTGPSITVKLDGCFPGQQATNNFSAGISLGNACGLGYNYWENTFAACGGENPELRMTWNVTNPGKGVLNLTINNATAGNTTANGSTTNKSTAANKKITARLYSLGRGTFVKEWTFISGQQLYRLPVAGIMRGAYVLQLNSDGKQSAKQVFIE